MVKFAIFIFLITASLGFAEELPNPAPSIEKTEPKIEESQVDKNKTEENHPKIGSVEVKPIVSEQATKPQADEQKTNADRPIDYQLWFNVFLIVLTGCLVIVGILQFRVYKEQARYMREGLKISQQSAQAAEDSANAARKSADAAEQSAKLTIQHERPWIMVVPDTPEGWPTSDMPSFLFRFKWFATNIGRSPAFLTKIYVAACVGDLPIPDQRPPYGEPNVLAKFILPPNGKHQGQVGIPLTQTEITSIMAGDKCIAFFGFICYPDTGDDPHRTRFFSYWSHSQGGLWIFSPIGPPNTIEYT